MFKQKYRNIIPNETDPKKNKDKSSYCESYDVGGFENKVKLIIRSIHTEKSNYEVHGTFLYQIQNSSHFQIDAELDFSNSLHIRTQEKNTFEPNKKLFKTHIEPFNDSLFNSNKAKKIEEEEGICKVQYIRGYIIKAKLKCAFTFPSYEKQKSFIEQEHFEINENLKFWKKFKPSQIEQLITFGKNSSNTYESLFFPSKHNSQNSLSYLQNDDNQNQIFQNKMLNNNNNNNSNSNNNNIENIDRKISFVDETFPPLQTDFITLDLSKEIKTNPKLNLTETKNEKKKNIVFHYRNLEILQPGHKQIFYKEDLNPYDITSGFIVNYNIISVFSHLADYPKYINKLFPENTINDIGIYKVRLFLMGAWVNIYLDKYIPCFPMDFPIYTYSTNSLWVCLLEKAIAKNFGGYDNLKNISYFELYQILTGFPILHFKRTNERYFLNTNLVNQSSLIGTKDEIIEEFLKNESYLMGFYISDEYAKKKNEIKSKINLIKNKFFPVKSATKKSVFIKSIFNYQLKEYTKLTGKLTDLMKEKWELLSDTLEFSWDLILDIFDCIIIVKSKNYQELHFRNGFIRCQDYESPDYDRILAYSYYELKIKNLKNKEDSEIESKRSTLKEDNSRKLLNKSNINPENKNNKELLSCTLVLNLSNDHFLDNSFLSKEIDWKIGILQLNEKTKRETLRGSTYSSLNPNDPFHGKNPILIESPDFSIGYSLIFDLKLEEGEYIIVPMTMGYCMQKNPKIKSKEYSLRDKTKSLLPIQKTVISHFLDDIFYLNDPFCRDYLDYPILEKISSNILDNKGRKIRPIDEETFHSNYMKIGEYELNTFNLNFGLTKLAFKDYIYECMNLLGEEHKKSSMKNLGYEENMYPYIGRFFSVSFYFGYIKNYQKGQIIITPKNNLVDNNMDGIVNIRQLERNIAEFKNAEYNIPFRIYYEKEKNPWYTIEGVYMKKNPNEKKPDKKKLYSYNPENLLNQDVFYSTFKYDVKIMIKPGKLLFLMYVVNDILSDKSEEEKKEKEKMDKSKFFEKKNETKIYDEYFSDSSYSNEEEENNKQKNKNNINTNKKDSNLNDNEDDKKSSNSDISYDDS